ncbi:hypothetical protein DH2020_020789 [Rehmannia glutinosa]|uniref:Histone-lysine N-methyltransferase n=1 Tax=Rehmannia glutinosa TaxID=99300 RepID=A0ABR0WCC3_REHGL
MTPIATALTETDCRVKRGPYEVVMRSGEEKELVCKVYSLSKKSVKMSKETKMRVANAFRAMKGIGISEDKVKPVLKDLLKLYDKNWAYIEEENYRALADAIFERDEAEAVDCSKKIMESEKEDYLEEEALAAEEPERPLKRLRRRYRDGQSSSLNVPNSSVAKLPLVTPKEEPNELPETCLPKLNASQGVAESPQPNAENTRVNTQVITKPRSPPHSIRLRDRGEGSVSPQIPSGKKRPVPESSSHAVSLKEPNVQPSIVLSPKHKSIASHALIKPVDETITDDLPRLDVPISVINPDSSSAGNSSSWIVTFREHDNHEPSVSQSVNEKERADSNAAPNEQRNKGELAMITGQCSNLEFASSSFEEVKISLRLALGRPDFHRLSPATVLQLLEEKCLRSYKSLDPNFSVMYLMKEMRPCFPKLGSDLNSESQATVNVTPTIDLMIKSSERGLYISSLNDSGNSQFDAEASVPKTLLLPPCYSIDDGSHRREMDGGDDHPGTNVQNKENCLEETNLSLVVVQQPYVTPEMIRSLHDVVDISKGQEKVNCCSTCSGDCLSLSEPCACAHETGGEFAYTPDGLVKEELLEECISMNRDPKKHSQFFCKECPLERSKSEGIIEPCKGHLMRKFIKECWWRCGCDKQCGNRVVQRGITRNLQVFMTPEGKGWGLRALEDLPKGAFVCEYVGEVLTYAELYDRVLRCPKGEKHSYPVLLDADWDAEGALKDEEALCLDATYYGNVARFINHRCYDSNLVNIPVKVEIPDNHYYHLAFFTTRKVKAMEELTWDYGIDFDDHDHLIKAFRCQCGSKFCRNIKRSSKMLLANTLFLLIPASLLDLTVS